MARVWRARKSQNKNYRLIIQYFPISCPAIPFLAIILQMTSSASNNIIKLEKKEKNLRNLQNLLILQESAPQRNQLPKNIQPALRIDKTTALKAILKIKKKKKEQSLPQNLLKLQTKTVKNTINPKNILNLKNPYPNETKLQLNEQTIKQELLNINLAEDTLPENQFTDFDQTNHKTIAEPESIHYIPAPKKAFTPSFYKENIFIDFSRKTRPWFTKLFSYFKNQYKNFKKYFLNNLKRNIGIFSFKTKLFLKPEFAYGWERRITYFLIASIFVSFTVSATAFSQKINFAKKQVLGKATEIFSHFKEGSLALLDQKFELAEGEFRTAENQLLTLQEEIKAINNLLIPLAKMSPKNNQIKQGMKILNIAQESAQAAEKSAQILARFYNLDKIYGDDQFKLDQKLTLTEAMNKSREDLGQIVFHLKNINNELSNVDSSEFADYAETFQTVQDKSKKAQSNIENFLKHLDTLLDFLGHNQKKRYLLLFQNNNEIRATGGFIGTYALLDFDRGKVENLKIDGIYNPAGQLNLKIKPPKPIRFFNKIWNIQDSNWFPNFPTSAQKIAWFLQKTGGPSVDGVIAITQDVIADFLQLSGPIAMEEYHTTIDASNFLSQTQKEVELEYDRELNQPKKFIADLAPKLLNQLFNEDKISKIDLLNLINKNLKKKNLLLFSFNNQAQNFFEEQNWDGAIKQAQKDYLAVINSNISGGKTDTLIQESIDLKTLIQEDGSIINYLKITRKHTGDNQWPSARNIIYQRIYTPLGSKFLESRNFDKIEIPPTSPEEESYKEDPLVAKIEQDKKITSNNTEIFEEAEKTVFANWIALDPGQEKTVLYKYELPFKINLEDIDSYSLLLQKQAGSVGSKVNLSIYLPRKIKAIWKNQGKDEEEFGLVEFEDILDQDKYFAVMLEKM